jgi:hypothetical protein
VNDRSNEKKSHPKLLNEKSIERLRTIHKPIEPASLSLKAKIGKIVSTL